MVKIGMIETPMNSVLFDKMKDDYEAHCEAIRREADRRFPRLSESLSKNRVVLPVEVLAQLLGTW